MRVADLRITLSDDVLRASERAVRALEAVTGTIGQGRAEAAIVETVRQSERDRLSRRMILQAVEMQQAREREAMARKPSRGNTKAQKYESYRIDAIDYVTNRDGKIDEIVEDICRKNPRLSRFEARRIVTEHWAKMEQENDVRNTVRSLDLGFDERALMQRVNKSIARPNALDQTLQAFGLGRRP